MKEKTGIEAMLEDLSKLMLFIQENLKKPLSGDLPPDIMERLEALKKNVEAFENLSEPLLKGPPAERDEIFDRAQKLKAEASVMHGDLVKKFPPVPPPKPPLKGSKMKTRKGWLKS